MNRTPEIAPIVLDVLQDCGSYALPEKTLHRHLNSRIRPPASDDQFRAAIGYLNSQGQINSLPGEHGSDEPRWLLTERGKVVLAQR